MTNFLEENGYWPSYNIPYFQNIYNISGFPQYVEKFGDLFSYNSNFYHPIIVFYFYNFFFPQKECPRAKIFKRDQNNVQTIDSLKWIMRYNDWQNDEFSEGNAGKQNDFLNKFSFIFFKSGFTICARFDLNINNHTYPDVGKYPSGGIDSKITSYSLYLKGMEVQAQSGLYLLFFLFVFIYFLIRSNL
jgi:hypothetical protein